jgi:hypothetical protein
MSEKTARQKAQSSRAAFFVRIGQVGRASDAHRDDETLPLFPLCLILEADGTLAKELAHLPAYYHLHGCYC